MSNHEDRTKRTRITARYITVGTILTEWSALWLIQQNYPNTFTLGTFIATGLIMTGLSVAIIGFRMGQLAREANQDAKDVPEDPPAEPSRLIVADEPVAQPSRVVVHE